MMEFVEHPLIRPETVERRAYQDNIAKKALTGNTLVVMPTALGKTIVAVLVIAEVLKNPDKKILFLAPTKPLVTQHYNTLKGILNIDEDSFAVLTGEVSFAERPEIFEKRIICATPQTIRNELGKGRLDLESVGLLVVDESHRSVRKYSYVDVAQKYLEQAKNPLILGLTASPSSEKVNEICEHLSIQNIEIRSEQDEDVIPYIQKKEFENVYVELPPEFDEIRAKLKSYYEEGLQKLKDMGFVYTDHLMKRDLIKLQRIAFRDKIFSVLTISSAMLKVGHALELLETQGIFALYSYFQKLKEQDARVSKSLMKDERIVKALNLTKNLYAFNKDHPKLEKLKEIFVEEFKKNPNTKAIVFSHFRESSQRITEDLKEFGAVRFVGQASKGRDIGLNQKQQAKILRDFRDGKHNILVCTSVGEEGLDIPSVDMVVFYEPVPSEIRKIQREGRTGRRRAGKVFVLITRKTKDEIYYWMSVHKEQKMHKVLEDMKEDLKSGSEQKKLIGFGE